MGRDKPEANGDDEDPRDRIPLGSEMRSHKDLEHARRESPPTEDDSDRDD